MLAIYSIKENYKNDCDLKPTGHSDFIFDVRVFQEYVHICTKYEVAMFEPTARRSVHRHQQRRTTDKAWLCKELKFCGCFH